MPITMAAEHGIRYYYVIKCSAGKIKFYRPRL